MGLKTIIINEDPVFGVAVIYCSVADCGNHLGWLPARQLLVTFFDNSAADTRPLCRRTALGHEKDIQRIAETLNGVSRHCLAQRLSPSLSTHRVE